MIEVQLPDGTVNEYTDDASSLDVARSIGERLAADVVAAEVNGKIVDAARPLAEGRENDDGPIRLKLLTSRDPVHWDRPDTPEPLIDVGGIGQWDRFTNMITGAPPIRVGDLLYIYYRGMATRHSIGGTFQGNDNADRTRGGIGLATLRVDGFASLAASYSGGRVTTKPFRFDGGRLRVNAKADFGRIRVEVLDEAGTPIEGFESDNCRPLSADKIDGQVEWKNQPTLAPLKGRPIRLRFDLHNARLFSYTIG